ncbi:MAG: alpha/beta hydrolase [Bacillota bacterium]
MRLRLAACLLLGAPLMACVTPPVPSAPIPVKLLPAPQPANGRFLVVVLPGRGDDFDALTHTGMAEAVQKSWPQADVLLAGASLGYYSDGKIAARLHVQIIAAARERGYREIWLTGASLGGTGALLYEYAYPHDVTGLVLYAPFMGNPHVVKTVADAGGPASWDPGPPSLDPGGGDFQKDLWRVVKFWQNPAEARRIWLVCGEDDGFIDAARLMAPLLPADHTVQLPGGHDWDVWDRGASLVFTRIAAMPR